MLSGEKVRSARLQRGWSQGELARRSGVDRSVISRLEGGSRIDVYLSTLDALAAALGCPAISLADFSADADDPLLRAILAETLSLTPEGRRKLLEYAELLHLREETGEARPRPSLQLP